MARPLLSGPEWVLKAQSDRGQEINTGIACNQACLDHAFAKKMVSCLLNPRAGRETQLVLSPTRRARSVAIVGAGPAGLAAAVNAAQRCHRVTLFEANDFIGGQFDLARRIPGKGEFGETIRYFTTMLDKHRVVVRLGTRVPAPAHQLRSGPATATTGGQRGGLRRPGTVRDLEDALRCDGTDPFIIGGAALAAELDAKRAIKQGTELAARL